MAVVVQQMVPAESGGVMFTANPVTGSRHEIVINATWGLGEAIVGGLVTPDHLTVDKRSGKIRTLSVAEKTVMTVPVPGGTEERPVPRARRRARVLTDAHVGQLVKLAKAVEAHAGQPQEPRMVLGG